MHGNVCEWFSDRFGDVLSGGVDPAGLEEGLYRVNRGGSWWGIPGFCRSADRNDSIPSSRDIGLGFRVARSSVGSVTVSAGMEGEPDTEA